MNHSYPQFQYSFLASLSVGAKAIFMIVAYGFSGATLLSMLFILKDGELSSLLPLSPFLFISAFLQSILRIQTCLIAEPNQLKWYNRFCGIACFKKEIAISSIRHFCLKKSYSIAQSLQSTSQQERSITYLINVSDERGERPLFETAGATALQELFIFLQKQYPQLTYINQLDEQEETTQKNIEWKEINKATCVFLGFFAFILCMILSDAVSQLRENYAFYGHKTELSTWLFGPISIILACLLGLGLLLWLWRKWGRTRPRKPQP